MRVILYLRVSTDEQSADMQRAALTEYCKARSWCVVDVIEETASGGRVDRPRRLELLKRAANAKPGFDAVMVWKLDRWSRSTGDILTTIDQLRECGIGFVSLTESLDLATPSGRALMGMLAVFAQFEREMIQQRVSEGIKRYREKHGKWGRPAKAQQVAGFVRAMYERGWTRRRIAEVAGISQSSVFRILRNRKLYKTE